MSLAYQSQSTLYSLSAEAKKVAVAGLAVNQYAIDEVGWTREPETI